MISPITVFDDGKLLVHHSGTFYHLIGPGPEGHRLYDSSEIDSYIAEHPELLSSDQPPSEAILAAIEDSRRAAYVAESDPLMAQYLRGEVDKQVWLDKVTEIRDRYPKT